MARPRVVIHEPEHRRRSIAVEPDPMASRTYDHNIAAYFDFLRAEARKRGYEIATDTRDDPGAMISIEAAGDDKRAVHDWFAQQPDLWNWLSTADERDAAPSRLG